MQNIITNILSQPQLASAQTMPTGVLMAFGLLLTWSLVWKGIALWKSARLSHKKWFVILLVLNTAGILEIIYIYFVARKYTVETEEQTMSEVK